MLTLVLALVSSEPATDELIESARSTDPTVAAGAFAELARRSSGPDADPMIFGALVNWRRAYERAYERDSKPEYVCNGLELLASTTSSDAELLRERAWFESAADADGVTCSDDTAGDAPNLEPVEPAPIPREPVTTPPVARPKPPPTVAPVHPANHDAGIRQVAPRRLTIAGAVLTSIGLAGCAALTGQGIVYATELRSFRRASSFDTAQFSKLQRLEIGMVATGVTSGVALVSGIVSLAVSRRNHRRLQVQPTIGGVALNGRF